RVLGRNQQGQLLRRCQEDIRRRKFLTLALVCGRIAGSCLDGNVELHLFDRLAEIALDVDRQRLERRNVERVDASICLARLTFCALRQLSQRRQETSQRLARASRGDQQHRLSISRLFQKSKLVRARRPATRRKPARKRFGKQRGVQRLRHAPTGRVGKLFRQEQMARNGKD